MGRINVLGFDIANLIAAGEVVDRPASVVKELLENAIDSGASKITIEIKNGGTSFIRIADNGCGIEFDDLPVAILRHATSKIKDATDLESIMTLGFRGEALAAISSVSKVRIMSKPKGEEMGSLLEAHAGQVISHMKTGCLEGTTVIVEDIFYNVPARKKFLKRDAYEAAQISSVVEKVAMSRPDISFKYIIDGDVKYITTGDSNTLNTIYAILGRDVAKKSIKVDRSENGISVQGFISTPELVRGNRNLETFYVNSRFIRSGIMSKAIEQAYTSYIPQDKFPFCVLNIQIDPTLVDVNVHPAKLEVKFSNEQLIFDAVYYAARTALENSIQRPTLYNEPTVSVANEPFKANDREAPPPEKIVFDTKGNVGVLNKDKTIDYTFSAPKSEGKIKVEYEKDDFVPDFLKKYDKPSTVLHASNGTEEHSDSYKTEELTPKEMASLLFGEEKPPLSVPKESSTEAKTVAKRIVPDYRIVGEAFNCYVIVELGDIMYLIDKHAAHERIIFEDLKKTSEATPSSQLLFIPIEAYLSNEEIGSASIWQHELNKIGFGFELKGNYAVISEVPSEIEPSAASDTFIELVSGLVNGEADAGKARIELFEKALYQASCKAAIKAGRIYDTEHIKWIIDRVLTLDNIKYCPHGRPVAFEITKHFLEKQFERIK